MNEKISYLSPVVVVAALGYFVDIYDLVLFGMERVSSLSDILSHTLPTEELPKIKEYITTVGASLLNWQMLGMVLGGIFWGVLGDKKGRLSVLFGSIILYSIANFANGFVHDIFWYKVLRFVSGFGLAGELGAGVTLVNELFDKERRGIGTTIVASVGLMGAVFGGLTTFLLDSWRMSYIIGGVLGFLLLMLRLGVKESGMYQAMEQNVSVSKGNFFYLFTHPRLLIKYLYVILIAVPVWFIMLFFVQFSPEMMRILGMQNPPTEAYMPIMVAYMGITIGDVMSGLLSYRLRSRKKPLYIFILFTMLLAVAFYFNAFKSTTIFYTFIFWIGVGTGYWAVFMSVAAENFGTNIRSTVTTTAPNFVRGSVLLMTTSHLYLKNVFDFWTSITIIGTVVFGLAFLSCYLMQETYSKDLNYLE